MRIRNPRSRVSAPPQSEQFHSLFPRFFFLQAGKNTKKSGDPQNREIEIAIQATLLIHTEIIP